MKPILTSMAVALAMATPLGATEQPYAGQDARDVASLSPADIDALLAGEGWGLALPAELNGYPGPAHVLEMAEELALTDAQRVEVRAIFDAMRAEAKALGADYVEAERHLSRMFDAGHANPALLDKMLSESSDILANLRSVHLSAHLQVKPLLTPDQIAKYDTLRGYGSGSAGTHTNHGGH